jgi:transposase InsO family protein
LLVAETHQAHFQPDCDDHERVMANSFPLQLLLATFGGWVNRDQANVVGYLIEENRVLKEQLGDRRLRLSDGQRRRLAAKGKVLGRRLLAKVATIVTPDTILRWHQRLIASKWTRRTKRVGRPGLMKAINELIVRMATDNSSWGYCRIQGEMKKLGHRVAPSTIASTLKSHGIPPSPDRPTSWRTFLQTHADVIAAADFFTAEVWTARGLVTHYVLFVIHHATRAVHIAGISTNPDATFIAQVARNLTDTIDGFLRNIRYLVIDRDSKFTADFARTLEDAGVEVVRTAFQAPNMNAIAERWVLSVKTECLDRIILFGQGHLERVLREYTAHYNAERPHQGLGNQPLDGAPPNGDGDVVVRERLGGLLNSYHRVA